VVKVVLGGIVLPWQLVVGEGRQQLGHRQTDRLWRARVPVGSSRGLNVEAAGGAAARAVQQQLLQVPILRRRDPPEEVDKRRIGRLVA
jgi:hypothetical protein